MAKQYIKTLARKLEKELDDGKHNNIHTYRPELRSNDEDSLAIKTIQERVLPNENFHP